MLRLVLSRRLILREKAKPVALLVVSIILHLNSLNRLSMRLGFMLYRWANYLLYLVCRTKVILKIGKGGDLRGPFTLPISRTVRLVLRLVCCGFGGLSRPTTYLPLQPRRPTRRVVKWLHGLRISGPLPHVPLPRLSS